MAKVTDNILLSGVHGTFAKQVVFRRYFGQLILSKKPVFINRVLSPAQQAVRARFRDAIIYGKSVLANPNVLALYQAVVKSGQSAYNLAVADAFHAPEITRVDIHSGDTICIRATDVIKVKMVSVLIYNTNRQLLETGNAIQDVDGNEWTYTIRIPVAGSKLEIRVYDLPGNVTIKELVL
ncbi:hypothetical protein [Chitinophaga sp. 212800010-3]|uniref:hypothetical protein n=1 Tax=unclassified Chitinophaga TaxID=2619133 RepID=UPI002DEC2732|nr:hypothetical protein [Chitinophaga sp. 212800010-3]